ncbi:uncharacterized protein B0T15DRAFT_416901 [Chaetomium strumarium]|uniref:Uncharacterized protein n=1 Tax=Chaetomium strumarium TaxID=1170767 RepID=A0AAJ0GU71_9PEZI|nr:hypothetical protein B0T15DRAFT_416901 [Chaetomium strumarium]
MGRPAGSVGRPQLKAEDLIRIQTLSRDAQMGPTQISKITGYSLHQIKYALKKKTPTVGVRTGRPRKGEPSPRKKKEGAKEGGSGTTSAERLGEEDEPMQDSSLGEKAVEQQPALVEQQLIQHLADHTAEPPPPPPQPAAAAQSSQPPTAAGQPEQQPGEVRTEPVAQQ